jgi:transposase
MSKIHDLVRLVLTSELPDTHISMALTLSRNTVRRYRKLVIEKGLSWTDVEILSTTQLDSLFNKRPGRLSECVLPDWERCISELERVGVTRTLLWEEYRANTPESSLSYSQFSELLRRHMQKTRRSMRQAHVPGERVFVDYSGKRPHYVDPQTGESIPVELFVSCLGYSNLTFAMVTHSQKIPDWVAAHVAMFNYFGGASQIIVPDNLRSAVTKSGREPVLNRTYADMARHYGSVVIPARGYKPKDKAKVEGAVKIVQRWILARLRNQTFFSLFELNVAILDLVEDLNNRLFKRIPGTRRSRFNEHEQMTLLPLPSHPYEFVQWSAMQTVGPDYHVCVEGHWYSVPHRLVGQKVEARNGTAVVEVFFDGIRVATHVRSEIVGGSTTLAEHQPPNHRAYAERNPEQYIAWARLIGPYTVQVVEAQFARKVPAVGFPACDALRKTAKQHGNEKFELAAKRAIVIGSLTAKSIRSILNTGLYLTDPSTAEPTTQLPSHSNVRGPGYYSQGEQAC